MQELDKTRVVVQKMKSKSYQVFNIIKAYLYNFDPLNPTFIQKKMGFTGVYIIFLISAQKHRL